MEKKQIFITATNTDIGKTYAASKFLNYYAKQGLKVGYFKPFETGVISHPIDGLKMLELTKKLNKEFEAININDVVPYQFILPAAPFVSNKKENNINIDIEFIKEKRDYLMNFCDILIIEGAGGLMVPLKKEYFIIDLIKELNCKTILITPSKLGCINDTLLSLQALKRQNINHEWYINLFQDKDSFYEVSYPFYKEYFEEIKFLDDIS